MADLLNIEIYDGKYRLIQHQDGSGEILRYDEPWLSPLCNVSASNMILAMGYELERLRAIEQAAIRWVKDELDGSEKSIIRENSYRLGALWKN